MGYKAKRLPGLEVPPIGESVEKQMSEKVLKFEFLVLEGLGFSCWFELPYEYVERFQCAELDAYTLQQLKRYASYYVNDSFRTRVGLVQSAEHIAYACLKLSSEYLRVSINIGVDEETYCCIRSIYLGKAQR